MSHLPRMTALCVSLVTACSAPPVSDRPGDDPPAGQARSAIFGGEPDRDHEAVVALLGAEHACSGTIVATHPPLLFVLTAAHCVAPHAPTDPEMALLGDDYLEPDAQFEIDHCVAAPGYDGEVLDFAMCRGSGATASTPFVEAAPGRDGLAPGEFVEHVGYGITEQDRDNSVRYHVIGAIEGLDDEVIWYSQRDGGPCMGDSGGPQLSMGDEPRVVGVTSYGDPDCADYGVSGRVAPVYESFVLPYVESWLPQGAGGGGGLAGGEPLGWAGSAGDAAADGGGTEPKGDEVPHARSDVDSSRSGEGAAHCSTVAGHRRGPGPVRWIAAMPLVWALRRRLAGGSRRGRRR